MTITSTSVLAGRRKYLTPREIEILDLIISGLRPGEVTRQLGISPKTMDNHLANARGALGCVTTYQLAVVWALKSGVECKQDDYVQRALAKADAALELAEEALGGSTVGSRPVSLLQGIIQDLVAIRRNQEVKV